MPLIQEIQSYLSLEDTNDIKNAIIDYTNADKSTKIFIDGKEQCLEMITLCSFVEGLLDRLHKDDKSISETTYLDLSNKYGLRSIGSETWFSIVKDNPFL